MRYKSIYTLIRIFQWLCENPFKNDKMLALYNKILVSKK